MKGGTRKRGSSWSYYFDAGTIGGKRQKKEKGGFATKKEAEAALADALSRFNATGMVFEPSQMTLADYLDEWFELYCRPNLRYNTQVDYDRVIENHLKPDLGHYRLRALTAAVIQSYVNGLKMRGLAKATAFNIYAVLSGALNYAVEPMQYLEFNPCRNVRFPKYARVEQEIHVFLDVNAMRRIFERFPESSPFYVPLMIGYYCGLRVSECFALTWDDIDLGACTLTVDKQLVKRNFGNDVRGQKVQGRKASEWYFGPPKTQSSVRTIKFGPALRECLEKARRKKQSSRLALGKDFFEYYRQTETDEKGDPIQHIVGVQRLVPVDLPLADLVCVREDGTMLSADSFKYCCRVVRHDLGLTFNYHSLRHTHATMLFEAGADIKDIQERLGHATVQTTIDMYVHNTEQIKDRSVALFEAVALKA